MTERQGSPLGVGAAEKAGLSGENRERCPPANCQSASENDFGGWFLFRSRRGLAYLVPEKAEALLLSRCKKGAAKTESTLLSADGGLTVQCPAGRYLFREPFASPSAHS
jgi:hypothetical protein